ncbi:DUF4198 domain-containing protein [Cognatishimia sp. F0-27]|nr:DUF4198 domain-containing protein [Cognatishimia sp. F0-27]MCC1492225.1 DUF4198 domain-containing protein [Cognatishimia sp. F0-27]
MIVGLLMLAAPALAHEFWIDPDRFTVESGGEIVAAIRVGETLKGSSYSYVPPNFKRFDIVMNGTVTPVDGRAGDRPALTMVAPDDGLAVIVHVTKDYTLTYREWDKFVNFTEHKDFEEVLAEHAERGLPQQGFRERYSRHAKSLIAVAGGQGADSEVGLETEIVALANPYTDDVSDGLPVRVLYQGAPRPDVQVELFARDPEGTVTVTLHRTDADGVARLPVEPGWMYLADHVVMRPLVAESETDPVWESLWASLTFGVGIP